MAHCFKITLILLTILLIISGCGMQLTIPGKPVFGDDINKLKSQGFITVGAQNITEMQNMVRPRGICKTKRNVCGMDAGISAAFLLNPREAFYDLEKPPARLDEMLGYSKLAKEYPIMRPKEFPTVDVGVFPNTLATFWTRHLKNFTAKALSFDSFDELLPVIKKEIKDGRPVLIDVRITPQGLPAFMPDDHLGLRAFWNGHWIVLVGYNEKGEGEWLVRDNGGLYDTVKGYLGTGLIKISQPSLKKLADNAELAEDLKLYIGDPSLPIFLDDWDNSDNEAQLQKDFKDIKVYNIVVFKKR